MSLDLFSPARAPKARREFEYEDEFPACRSLLYTDNGSEPGPRACRVNHAETGEVSHGAWVGTVWSSWTDAEAARSLADFGPRPAAGPLCTDCGIRPAAGLCGVCRTAADRDENRETESEAAA